MNIIMHLQVVLFLAMFLLVKTQMGILIAYLKAVCAIQ